MKRIISMVLVLALLLGLTACGSSQSTVEKAKETTTEKAKDIVKDAKVGLSTASEFASAQTEKAKKAISELSLPDFKKGFETASSFFGATVASVGGQAYVEKVANAITDLESNIASRVNKGAITSNAGYLAEEWHAGTFNIDAAARGSNLHANTDKSNGLGSDDISVGDEIQASSKYYKNAELSAKQQAKNYIQRYNEYASKASNPVSMDEWLTSKGINLAIDDPDLYWSIYKDQIRIIPSDQYDEAVACLKKSIESNKAKDGTNRQQLSKSQQETLKNLRTRLEASDGTKSIPLSKAEAEAIAEAAQNGDFSAKDFGVTTSSAIKGTYIAKQAISAGATSAIIEAATVLGPEIYEIIKKGIETGQIDEGELKNIGIDGLSASADGFLKGSISNALVVMFQAGKFGADYINPSPDLIGAATVLVVDAIKYGIMLNNGEIGMNEYIDLIAQELVVSAGSIGSAALVGLLFPNVTLAILLGGFVGGLVVSAGYTTGKTYALALIDSSGVDLLVPIQASSDTIKGIKETTKIKVKDAVSSLKNIGTGIAKNTTIKVYNLTEQFDFD